MVLELHSIYPMKHSPEIKHRTSDSSAPSVLIVDDEDAIRDSVHYVLTEEGYHCFNASSGKEAVQLADAHSLDLLIIEFQLPEQNGIETLIDIQRVSPDIKIILVTCYTNSDIIEKALNAGADHYLLKPVDFDELIRLVNNIFADQH